MRVEKRLQPSPAALALASLGAVAFTLLVSSVLVLAAGAPVGRTYGLLLQGAFGSCSPGARR
jgi:simple sugar transport system permease protein